MCLQEVRCRDAEETECSSRERNLFSIAQDFESEKNRYFICGDLIEFNRLSGDTTRFTTRDNSARNSGTAKEFEYNSQRPGRGL